SVRICFAIFETAKATVEATALSPLHERILRAAVDRIIPPDDAPGASDAGVLEYLARKLGGDPVAVAGFAAGLDGLDAEATARSGRGLAALHAAEQDDVLRVAESGSTIAPWTVEPATFFSALVETTAEGYYGDPGNGGNRGEVSWRMCGFTERIRV